MPTRHSLPHACGGVSNILLSFSGGKESSPRLWGCFFLHLCVEPFNTVFPTPVGVFPVTLSPQRMTSSLPHACGGVSSHGVSGPSCGKSSPRLWGCFYSALLSTFPALVFPTPVGVFPILDAAHGILKRLPHACGGVSLFRAHSIAADKSSPRLWGCFLAKDALALCYVVFPTPVGVFPVARQRREQSGRLPHACGGVSIKAQFQNAVGPSSPRLWGCFQAGDGRRPEYCVFPTPVGVFPTTTWLIRSATSLPHACGGVSKVWICLCDIKWSSPRLWGCFFGADTRGC